MFIIPKRKPLTPDPNLSISKSQQLISDQSFWYKFIFHPGYQSLILSGIVLIIVYLLLIFNYKMLFTIPKITLLQFLSLFVIAIVSHGMIAVTLQPDLGIALSAWY